jgi:hypothetical protein
MGGSLSKFGRIDLDLDIDVDDGDEPIKPPLSTTTPSFGELDLESIGDIPADDDERPPQPRVSQRARRLPFETPTRESIEVAKLAEEETRIAERAALANALAKSKIDDNDEADQLARRALSKSAPSASGVASRDDRVAAMRDLYVQGNADAALALASRMAVDLEADPEIVIEEPPRGAFGTIDPILGDDADPEEHTAVVEACADSRRLVVMTSRHVPRLLVGAKDIPSLPIDPRAAFLVGHIDGVQSMEEILDVCAMPESEALALFERLRIMGVISFE